METLRISGDEKRALIALMGDGSQRSLKLGTLGPEGTSSEYVARLMTRLLGDRGRFGIVLEETFEHCMDALTEGRIDLALVPHAYAGINAFYMNPLLEPSIVFRGSTPEYGLAARSDFAFREELLFTDTVVTHPAPIPLLEYYFDRPVKLVTTTSTSQAAGQVADGLYNIAITNEQAARQHNLKFVYRFSPIPMTWTVFSKRIEKEGPR
ncbi:prephenate dehydratase domain-containing protein [Streptomyces sp. NPDC013978]|uniref:prephenate dehydratase domain-containing protein n=1 Tax=Streptomyces sp. NPDC013978 TaxID=3364869 RepID=UPI0036FA9CAE